MEFLEEVKTNTLNAFANQDYQFETLLSRLNIKPDPEDIHYSIRCLYGSIRP